MGTVLAIEKDGVVYLGTDEIKLYGGINLYLNKENNFSIHKYKSGIIVASTGRRSITQQFYLHDEWFDLKSDDVFDKKFIVTNIIPKFYESIKNSDKWEKGKDDEIKRLDVNFLIAKDSDIYLISGDLSVDKCKDVACISDDDGELMLYAYAKLSKDEPLVTIKKAFELGSKQIANIKNNVYVIDTNSLEFKKMEDVKCL